MGTESTISHLMLDRTWCNMLEVNGCIEFFFFFFVITLFTCRTEITFYGRGYLENIGQECRGVILRNLIKQLLHALIPPVGSKMIIVIFSHRFPLMQRVGHVGTNTDDLW